MFPPTISDLGGAVTLDNKSTNFIALPHFAAEYRGRDSNLHAARVQAGYDGAASERSQPWSQHLRAVAASTLAQPRANMSFLAVSHGRSIAMQHLGGTDDAQKHAGVVTAVTDGTVWHTYAHYQHVDRQTGDRVYYQYPVDSGTLDTYRNFQRGHRVLRNAQSFAQEQSSEIRNRLLEQYAAESSLSPSDDTACLLDA